MLYNDLIPYNFEAITHNYVVNNDFKRLPRMQSTIYAMPTKV